MSGIRPSSLKIDSVRYQRNGSGGEGFFAVAFRFRQGQVWTPLVAAVHTGFGDDDGKFLPERTCVICPERPEECWDGPAFAPTLIEACTKAEKDGSAFR